MHSSAWYSKSRKIAPMPSWFRASKRCYLMRPWRAFWQRPSRRTARNSPPLPGDAEGGGLLKRLGVLFTDYAFFSGVDNDLVVDTGSMYAGIAREAHGRALFDQGPTTSHFHYFQNDATRAALRDWLTVESTEALELFKSLPGEV